MSKAVTFSVLKVSNKMCIKYYNQAASLNAHTLHQIEAFYYIMRTIFFFRILDSGSEYLDNKGNEILVIRNPCDLSKWFNCFKLLKWIYIKICNQILLKIYRFDMYTSYVWESFYNFENFTHSIVLRQGA